MVQRWFRGVVLPIMSATLLLAPATASSAEISALYVFGDSLSDTGNVNAVSGGFVPPPPSYSGGRFSNGPLWVEYLASQLQLPGPVPYAGGVSGAERSISFAYGGSGTGLTQTVPAGVPVPGLLGQVQRYNTLVGGGPAPVAGTADPDALYVIWSGGNDYILSGSGPPTSGYTPDPGVVIGNIATAISELHTAGARNFLVVNLPNMGDVPLAGALPPGAAAALNAVTAAHNAALDAAVAQLSATLGGISIDLFDVQSLIADVLASPGSYGLSNGLVPGPAAGCLFPPYNCPDLTGDFDTAGDGRVFWDELHPTTDMHRIIAAGAAAALGIPEPSSLAIFAVAMVGVALRRRARR